MRMVGKLMHKITNNPPEQTQSTWNKMFLKSETFTHTKPLDSLVATFTIESVLLSPISKNNWKKSNQFKHEWRHQWILPKFGLKAWFETFRFFVLLGESFVCIFIRSSPVFAFALNSTCIPVYRLQNRFVFEKKRTWKSSMYFQNHHLQIKIVQITNIISKDIINDNNHYSQMLLSHRLTTKLFAPAILQQNVIISKST